MYLCLHSYLYLYLYCVCICIFTCICMQCSCAKSVWKIHVIFICICIPWVLAVVREAGGIIHVILLDIGSTNPPPEWRDHNSRNFTTSNLNTRKKVKSQLRKDWKRQSFHFASKMFSLNIGQSPPLCFRNSKPQQFLLKNSNLHFFLLKIIKMRAPFLST